MANPLTQVTDALWDMLEANSAFTLLVPVSNRIKYDNPHPEKRNVMKADFPEVRIREYSTNTNIHRTSNSVTFAKQYHVQIATGTQSLVSVHDVEWEILRSFAGWTTTLEALTWDQDASQFVKRADLANAQQTLESQEANRGIKGWVTVMVAEVEFWFDNTLIPA